MLCSYNICLFAISNAKATTLGVKQASATVDDSPQSWHVNNSCTSQAEPEAIPSLKRNDFETATSQTALTENNEQDQVTQIVRSSPINSKKVNCVS